MANTRMLSRFIRSGAEIRTLRPGTHGPQQIDRSRPGIRRQTGHNVEIKGDPRTTVKGRGHTADDHKVNVMVVKLAQNLEKVAGHGIVVA